MAPVASSPAFISRGPSSSSGRGIGEFSAGDNPAMD